MYVVLCKNGFEFDSAHYLNNYKGKCANLHGHSWKFDVVISGEVNPSTGMLMDFKELKELVNRKVVERVDHMCLNDVLGFNPTAENLSKWIYTELVGDLPEGVELMFIRLYENYPSSAIIYDGQ